MSEHVGARTHASVVGAPHTSLIAGGNRRRLAAAGLALFLALAPGAVAQAGEDAGSAASAASAASGAGGASGAGAGRGADAGAGAAGGVTVVGTADAGSTDGPPAGSQQGSTDDAPDGGGSADAQPGTSSRPGDAGGSASADGTIELSATSSDSVTVTHVVVTPDGRWTTTVEAAGEDTGLTQTSRRRG